MGRYICGEFNENRAWMPRNTEKGTLEAGIFEQGSAAA